VEGLFVHRVSAARNIFHVKKSEGGGTGEESAHGCETGKKRNPADELAGYIARSKRFERTFRVAATKTKKKTLQETDDGIGGVGTALKEGWKISKVVAPSKEVL